MRHASELKETISSVFIHMVSRNLQYLDLKGVVLNTWKK